MTDIGDGARIGNHAVDPATNEQTGFVAFTTGGAATDPTTVRLVIQKPDESQLEYGWPVAGADGPLTKEATGRFYSDLVLDQSGKWQYRLIGAGAVAAVFEGSFRVQRQRVVG